MFTFSKRSNLIIVFYIFMYADYTFLSLVNIIIKFRKKKNHRLFKNNNRPYYIDGGSWSIGP